MTSRERVLAAIRHQETDRPPVHSMSFEDLAGIRQALGVPDDAAAQVALGLDIRAIWPEYRGPPLGTGENGVPVDEWGVTRGTGRFGPTYTMDLPRPLAGAETVADIERHPWPNPDWWDYEAAARSCRAYGGRFALKGPGWHPVFCWVCHLMGMQRALENLALRPALVEATAAHLADFYLRYHSRLLDATRGLMDIFDIGDDVAHDKGLIISPADWRRVFKPILARFMRMAKDRGFVTWYHCCGVVRDIVPDLIEIGVDVLEPCQVHLPGMDPEGLKRDFGDHIAFYGAVSVQTTLPRGTPEQVGAEVRERIRVLGRSGGYIVGPDHTVLRDTPVRNVLALYESAGSYVRPD